MVKRGRSGGRGGPSVDTIRWTLEEAYRGPAWHGPSVLVALEGVTHDTARWNPGTGRNSIWRLVLHLAYARHRVAGRLARAGGRPRPRFGRRRDPEWFPLLPEPADRAAWRADLELLETMHGALLDEVEAATPEVLARRRRASGRTLAEELLGSALHDVYHAGQIRLLDKLARQG